MTKMAAMHMYGKTFTNFLHKQKPYEFETLHVASGAHALQR